MISYLRIASASYVNEFTRFGSSNWIERFYQFSTALKIGLVWAICFVSSETISANDSNLVTPWWPLLFTHYMQLPICRILTSGLRMSPLMKTWTWNMIPKSFSIPSPWNVFIILTNSFLSVCQEHVPLLIVLYSQTNKHSTYLPTCQLHLFICEDRPNVGGNANM